jgi:hypothetical protein
MALPGFTAEASLGPTVQTYRFQGLRTGFGLSEVVPQQYLDGTEDEGDESGEMVADAEDLEGEAEDVET